MNAAEIEGVRFLPPKINPDRRGSLDVVFSKEWAGMPIAQWNVVRSAADVVRGVHAHSRYDEIYAPLIGRMLIVLKDARRKSPTFGQAIARWIDDGADNTLIVVPAGVAHGVFFQTAGILTYGLTSCWDGLGEFNCRWDDPGLVSQWPLIAPVLSDRDSAAGAFDAMVDALNAEL